MWTQTSALQAYSDNILQKQRTNDTVFSPAHCQMIMKGEEGGKQDRTDEERSHGAQTNFGVNAIVELMPRMTQSKLPEKEENNIELAPSLQNKELELELELDVKLAMEKRDLELALRLQEGEVKEDEKEHVEERDVELALDLQEEEVQKRNNLKNRLVKVERFVSCRLRRINDSQMNKCSDCH